MAETHMKLNRQSNLPLVCLIFGLLSFVPYVVLLIFIILDKLSYGDAISGLLDHLPGLTGILLYIMFLVVLLVIGIPFGLFGILFGIMAAIEKAEKHSALIYIGILSSLAGIISHIWLIAYAINFVNTHDILT